MTRTASPGAYHRYHIDTAETPDIVPWPTRFTVHVSKVGLSRHLLRELVHYRADLEIVLSRPCMYGVFSGPIGGFAPRPEHCVGCLRCTTQHPDFVEIRHNPLREKLGDSYFHFNHVNAASYEAQTGSIPVKGAGYRGKFGGAGWDGMWTDMSEIVRPTRDGIHGREFISTVVDIGARPNYLRFGPDGQLVGQVPHTFSIPIPMLFDAPPAAARSEAACRALAQAAQKVETLLVLPLATLRQCDPAGPHIVPLVAPAERPQVASLPFEPRLVELASWDPALYDEIRRCFPETLVALRLPYGPPETLLHYHALGVRVFHLTADYHGTGADGRFVSTLIQEAHKTFVKAGIREEVTLLGSGGIVAAEHVPKAIIMGLDAVVLDTPLLVAMQASFDGEFTNHNSANCQLPSRLTPAWGAQRLQNLMAAWRDQLLEILGAMGLREVRRLRGETGRAMFQENLEREAFAGIEGFGETAA